jgi:uncharacterized OB-fold protein
MSEPAANPAAKPLPRPDAASEPFFAGARRGELMLQRCSDCGACRLNALSRCDACRSPRFAWERASGRARLVSWAVMHQRYHPAFYDELPYLLAVVELEEGPRLLTRLADAEPGALRAGLPLRVVFEEVGEGIVLPKFAPA